jgi:o-succinylbenzoate synthase
VTALRSAIHRIGGRLESRAESARGGWSERTGLVLTIDDGVHQGFGECTPLPGFSPDTLGECEAALAALDLAAVGLATESGPADAQLQRWGDALPAGVPAARFALETALLDLIARRSDVPIWSLLAPSRPEPLPISTLVPMADPERTVAAARYAVERGYRTLKRKLAGPAHLDADRRALTALRQAFGDSIRLRLDANGSFSPDSAEAALRTLAPLEIEFLEEPVPSRDLAALGDSLVPLAFDESLVGDAWRRGLEGASAGTWVAAVLKPTVLGGFGACRALASELRAAGIAVSVSHAFEGPIALADRHHASGLARHAGLEAWPEVALEGFGEPTLEPPERAGLGLDAARVVAGGSTA